MLLTKGEVLSRSNLTGASLMERTQRGTAYTVIWLWRSADSRVRTYGGMSGYDASETNKFSLHFIPPGEGGEKCSGMLCQ